MRQKLHEATVYRYENRLNDYNEQVRTLTATFPIEVAVSTTNGSLSTNNNVKTTNSTHTAFTNYLGLRESDIIEQNGNFYKIDFINGLGRFPVLFLQQVENIEQ